MKHSATGKEIAIARSYDNAEVSIPKEREESLPSVYLDTTPEMIAGIALGDEVTVMLKGIVKAVSAREHGSDFSIDIVNMEVETGDNKMEEMLDD